MRGGRNRSTLVRWRTVVPFRKEGMGCRLMDETSDFGVLRCASPAPGAWPLLALDSPDPTLASGALRGAWRQPPRPTLVPTSAIGRRGTPSHACRPPHLPPVRQEYLSENPGG